MVIPHSNNPLSVGNAIVQNTVHYNSNIFFIVAYLSPCFTSINVLVMNGNVKTITTSQSNIGGLVLVTCCVNM